MYKPLQVSINSGQYAEAPCVLEASDFSDYTGVALLFEANDTRRGILTHYSTLKAREHAKKLEELVHAHNLEGQKPLIILAYAKHFFATSDHMHLKKLEGLLKKLFPESEIRAMVYHANPQEGTLTLNLGMPGVRFCE